MPKLRTFSTILALFAAAPVLAAPSALLQCDGYGRRQSVGESLARATVILGTLGLFGSAEADDTGARLDGDKGVAACTQALLDARASGNPVRRGEVLLMRAIRNLETKAYDAAYDDAAAVIATDVPEPLRANYVRSLGVSARIVQAKVRVMQGRQADAETIVADAVTLRPWGHFARGEAVEIMALSPEITPAEAAIFDRLIQIQPSSLLSRASAYEATGNWAAAARDLIMWNAARTAPHEITQARTALDLALAGDAAASEKLLAVAQQAVDELAVKASGSDKEAATAGQAVSRADELMQLARAQLALLGGNATEAAFTLNGRPRWLASPPMVAGVAHAVRAKLGPASTTIVRVDATKLLADARTVAVANVGGPEAMRTDAVILARWEEPGVPVAIGRELLAAVPKQLKIESVQDNKITQIQYDHYGLYADTATEALLAAAWLEAGKRGVDRFALIQRGQSVNVAREGLIYNFPTMWLVFPGDKLWESQSARALMASVIAAEIVPMFPRPAIVPTR